MTSLVQIPYKNPLSCEKSSISFSGKAGFLLRKWNPSEPAVLDRIPADLKELNPTQQLPDPDQCTKTLGIEWNARQDHFRLTVAALPISPSQHLSLTLLGPMISLVGSLPQSSRSRYSYSNSGNRMLAGMTPYHNLSWMSGYNSALSYTSSHTSTSLDVTLTRSLESPQSSSMDSVIPLSEPMG